MGDLHASPLLVLEGGGAIFHEQMCSSNLSITSLDELKKKHLALYFTAFAYYKM